MRWERFHMPRRLAIVVGEDSFWAEAIRLGRLKHYWEHQWRMPSSAVPFVVSCLSSITWVSSKKRHLLVLCPWVEDVLGLGLFQPARWLLCGKVSPSSPTSIHQCQIQAKLECSPGFKGNPVPAPPQSSRNWLSCQSSTPWALGIRNYRQLKRWACNVQSPARTLHQYLKG